MMLVHREVFWVENLIPGVDDQRKYEKKENRESGHIIKQEIMEPHREAVLKPSQIIV